VSDAELVKHIRIPQAQVHDGKFSKKQSREHRGMNDSARFLLIRAQWLKTRILNRGLYRITVNLIKVYVSSGRQVRLLSEGHSHKTESSVWHHRLASWKYLRSIVSQMNDLIQWLTFPSITGRIGCSADDRVAEPDVSSAAIKKRIAEKPRMVLLNFSRRRKPYGYNPNQ